MPRDQAMDEPARESLTVHAVLWEIRALLLSIPPPVRRSVLDRALEEARAVHGDQYEAEARMFLADVLEDDDTDR